MWPNLCNYNLISICVNNKVGVMSDDNNLSFILCCNK